MNCLPFLHRLHLNVSCVSQSVFSLNRKSFRSESREKWRSTSSFSSTTAEDSDCLFACRWKIFSSIVPVEMNRYTKPGRGCEITIGLGKKEANPHSFFCPSRQTRASACWSAAGFQSVRTKSVRVRLRKTSCIGGLPGSKRIRRLAPIRLIPHPPALLLNKKTNSLPFGSLN